MEITNNTPFKAEALPFKGPGNKNILTVIVKGTFDILPDKQAATSHDQIPIAFGDELYDEKNDNISVKFESDMAPFKPRADIVLTGRAYAQDRRTVLDVMLRVGNLKKILRIFGNRYWVSSFLAERPSEPEPFSVMDITYERAFGGIDMESGDFCRENPTGQGFYTKKTKKTLNNSPLPNIEDPDNLIRSWKDHPKPVGFGFYNKAWIPRASYAGTYDTKWRKERSPEFPEDFSFDYYNAAHPDLQVKGYLKGDEEVELVNLRPDGAVRFKLPGMKLKCKVMKLYDMVSPSAFGKRNENDPRLITEEADFNLDTLCLIPDENRFYLVWRALCPINDLTGSEVKEIQISKGLRVKG